LICGAANAAMVPKPMNFDKGLVLTKDTDILLSGDKWTIAVNTALEYLCYTYREYEASFEHCSSEDTDT
jgi:hypothetical protein